MSVVRDFPDLPPVWMLGVGTVAWTLDRWLPILRFDGDLARGAGVAVALGGVLLAVWAAAWFARKRTTIEPREEPDALIVEGPFRINRNPIYTGMTLVLLGWALWLGSLSAVLIVCVFPVVIDRRFVAGEEAMLRDAFGPSAETYIETTRRW